MKFEQILNINKSINKLKDLNKEFTYDIAKLLADNLAITNKIVNEQNIKLNSLTKKYGLFDGYQLVIDGDNLGLYNNEQSALYNEEFDIDEIGLKLLNINHTKILKIDITTAELISPLILK